VNRALNSTYHHFSSYETESDTGGLLESSLRGKGEGRPSSAKLNLPKLHLRILRIPSSPLRGQQLPLLHHGPTLSPQLVKVAMRSSIISSLMIIKIAARLSMFLSKPHCCHDIACFHRCWVARRWLLVVVVTLVA